MDRQDIWQARVVKHHRSRLETMHFLVCTEHPMEARTVAAMAVGHVRRLMDLNGPKPGQLVGKVFQNAGGEPFEVAEAAFSWNLKRKEYVSLEALDDSEPVSMDSSKYWIIPYNWHRNTWEGLQAV